MRHTYGPGMGKGLPRGSTTMSSGDDGTLKLKRGDLGGDSEVRQSKKVSYAVGGTQNDGSNRMESHSTMNGGDRRSMSPSPKCHMSNQSTHADGRQKSSNSNKYDHSKPVANRVSSYMEKSNSQDYVKIKDHYSTFYGQEDRQSPNLDTESGLAEPIFTSGMEYMGSDAKINFKKNHPSFGARYRDLEEDSPRPENKTRSHSKSRSRYMDNGQDLTTIEALRKKIESQDLELASLQLEIENKETDSKDRAKWHQEKEDSLENSVLELEAKLRDLIR